jgi:hypothetical protein
MGEIRTFEEAHIPDVAALELKVFHNRRQPAGPGLQQYFRQIFLDSPLRDEELPSLVYIHNNKLVGFIGVIPRRMVFCGRPIRVAVASQLMVDTEEYRGFAGMEMVRRLFLGPQDLTLTDGATESAYALWTALGGRAAQLYSLQWTRVFRPLGYLRGIAERRPKTGPVPRAIMRLLSPGCALADSALSRLPFNALSAPATEFRSEAAGGDALLECIREIGWRDALQPTYEPEFFRWLLAQAAAADRHGALKMAVVRDLGGATAGWYIYYAKRGGESTVLQIGASIRHFEDVFLALARDAWDSGATALGGQVAPRDLLSLSRRHCTFKYVGNGVLVHSRNSEIVSCILQGEAALTRLDGEWWTRFAVGEWH